MHNFEIVYPDFYRLSFPTSKSFLHPYFSHFYYSVLFIFIDKLRNYFLTNRSSSTCSTNDENHSPEIMDRCSKTDRRIYNRDPEIDPPGFRSCFKYIYVFRFRGGVSRRKWDFFFLFFFSPFFFGPYTASFDRACNCARKLLDCNGADASPVWKMRLPLILLYRHYHREF